MSVRAVTAAVATTRGQFPTGPTHSHRGRDGPTTSPLTRTGAVGLPSASCPGEPPSPSTPARPTRSWRDGTPVSMPTKRRAPHCSEFLADRRHSHDQADLLGLVDQSHRAQHGGDSATGEDAALAVAASTADPATTASRSLRSREGAASESGLGQQPSPNSERCRSRAARERLEPGHEAVAAPCPKLHAVEVVQFQQTAMGCRPSAGGAEDG
jgi:hypothetical protein